MTNPPRSVGKEFMAEGKIRIVLEGLRGAVIWTGMGLLAYPNLHAGEEA